LTSDLTFGFATPIDLWPSDLERRRAIVDELHTIGVDHIFMADHVSFRNGSGTDGFVEIAALSQLHAEMGVMISVYLLPLRHPMPVARQLASIATIAPGRVIFGVGIGGDDRHEVEVCGVDPGTRGRRTNESLAVIRRLMTGETVDHHGEFFRLEQAAIRPAVNPPIPVIVGGRSNAALERAARYSDGWIGAWCSPRRFAEAVELIDAMAVEAGRSHVAWRHGYQPWCGVADTAAEARAAVAYQMETFYHLPFEMFERYIPCGPPDEVAEALRPFVDAGCSLLNMKVAAATPGESVAGAAEIIRRLRP
jgi:alkanesulfonate monooxygenase SsuD/methylene tetrahydromethanopterin reductase-like flavin-dependent oxidoreductase (luciferase family)